MKRRGAVLTGAAVIAAATGVAVAFWRSRRTDGSGGPEAAPDIDLWSLHFDTPQAGTLALAGLRGRPLLINFWATWCPPCVAELPLLDRFAIEQRERGWQVIGLAIDQLEPVREFLRRQPVSFPVGLAGAGGIELARALGNTSGALPFTVVLDRSGRVVKRKLGVVTPEDLRAWSGASG